MIKLRSEKSLATAWQRYTDKVDEIVAKARKKHVVPFCKKRGWTFMAGNGSWNFDDEKGNMVDTSDYSDDPEFQDILMLMEVEVEGYGANAFGSLMEDVRRESK